VDPQFDRIATYSGFGYRWIGDSGEPAIETTAVDSVASAL
jgi:hypothetical protein